MSPQERGFIWLPGLPILKKRKTVQFILSSYTRQYFYHKNYVKHSLVLTNTQFSDTISSQAI